MNNSSFHLAYVHIQHNPFLYIALHCSFHPFLVVPYFFSLVKLVGSYPFLSNESARPTVCRHVISSCWALQLNNEHGQQVLSFRRPASLEHAQTISTRPPIIMLVRVSSIYIVAYLYFAAHFFTEKNGIKTLLKAFLLQSSLTFGPPKICLYVIFT